MLKKTFALLLILFSINAYSCWQVDGSLAIDGETFKFNQKVEHNKEYLFPLGNFILKFTLVPEGKNTTMKYVVDERKDSKLVLITKGSEENIQEKIKRDIFAKGEEGQPNTIITVKLRNI